MLIADGKAAKTDQRQRHARLPQGKARLLSPHRLERRIGQAIGLMPPSRTQAAVRPRMVAVQQPGRTIDSSTHELDSALAPQHCTLPHLLFEGQEAVSLLQRRHKNRKSPFHASNGATPSGRGRASKAATDPARLPTGYSPHQSMSIRRNTADLLADIEKSDRQHRIEGKLGNMCLPARSKALQFLTVNVPTRMSARLLRREESPAAGLINEDLDPSPLKPSLKARNTLYEKFRSQCLRKLRQPFANRQPTSSISRQEASAYEGKPVRVKADSNPGENRLIAATYDPNHLPLSSIRPPKHAHSSNGSAKREKLDPLETLSPRFESSGTQRVETNPLKIHQTGSSPSKFEPNLIQLLKSDTSRSIKESRPTAADHASEFSSIQMKQMALLSPSLGATLEYWRAAKTRKTRVTLSSMPNDDDKIVESQASLSNEALGQPGIEFVTAVKEGSLKLCELALKHNKNLVNFRDPAGMTPLHWATKRKHFQVGELLLKAGADPNAIDLVQPSLTSSSARRSPSPSRTPTSPWSR
jgi:hypothetical protein